MSRPACLVALFALIALTACYEPSYQEGIACGSDDSCPPGMTCANDGKCRRGDTGTQIDATPEVPTVDSGTVQPGDPDAPLPPVPDAAPVGCDGDDDCAVPPTLCQQPGTCDLEMRTCVFAPVDCSGSDTECTRGTCDPSAGCVAQPINESTPCGAGTSCEAFGACSFEGNVCDESGVRSRTCTNFTCQSGSCVGSSFQDTEECSRDTDGTQNCSPPTVTNCGACDYANVCDQDANQTCTCTSFSCSGGTCTASSSSCVQACSRDTDGARCGRNGFCSGGFCEVEPPCDPVCP